MSLKELLDSFCCCCCCERENQHFLKKKKKRWELVEYTHISARLRKGFCLYWRWVPTLALLLLISFFFFLFLFFVSRLFFFSFSPFSSIEKRPLFSQDLTDGRGNERVGTKLLSFLYIYNMAHTHCYWYITGTLNTLHATWKAPPPSKKERDVVLRSHISRAFFLHSKRTHLNRRR